MNPATTAKALSLVAEIVDLAVEHGPDVADVVRWAIDGCEETRKPESVARLHAEQKSKAALEKKLGRRL